MKKHSKGKPILVIIEPNVVKNGILVNEIKVVGAYKRRNSQNIIDKSTIKYIDKNKKRVTKWEKRTGLRLPVGISDSNSNNNISQSNTVVNNNSMQEKENDTDIQHSFDGRGAENADLLLLEKAIKMNDEGKSSEETLKRKNMIL